MSKIAVCKLYTRRFIKKLEGLLADEKTQEGITALKLDAIKECTIAMERARPSSRIEIWDFSVSHDNLYFRTSIF